DQLLEVDARIAERGRGLGHGLLVSLAHLRGLTSDSHPSSAATALRLEQNGIAHATGNLGRLVGVAEDALAPWNGTEPGLRHRALRWRLLAHEGHDVRRGADERDAVVLGERGELGRLGEEAPARVQRGALGLTRRLNEALRVEVALAG